MNEWMDEGMDGIRNQEMFICPKIHKSHYTIT